ncbi:hypothetical protein K3495_g17156 [Podosphaera aphanis]|nr:hypothetical protein K3495_g17156 [Podosphaera aphanis]
MKHFVRDCPDLELAVRAVEKHHENRRRDAKAKRSSEKKSYPTSSKAPLKTSKQPKKSRAYAAHQSESSSEESCGEDDIESVALTASEISN